MNNPIISVGTDIVEVKRFKRSHPNLNSTFYRSIFTKSELNYCSRYSDPYPHLAGIFAAKEAAIKCFRTPKRMIEIEIVHGSYDQPIVVTNHGRRTSEIKISISHTQSLAIAVAISVSDEECKKQ